MDVHIDYNTTNSAVYFMLIQQTNQILFSFHGHISVYHFNSTMYIHIQCIYMYICIHYKYCHHVCYVVSTCAVRGEDCTKTPPSVQFTLNQQYTLNIHGSTR